MRLVGWSVGWLFGFLEGENKRVGKESLEGGGEGRWMEKARVIMIKQDKKNSVDGVFSFSFYSLGILVLVMRGGEGNS